MQIKKLFASLALATTALGAHQGFNYGATNADGSCRSYADFKKLFQRAKGLAEPGMTSVRLYTSIQCGTAMAPISAFQAAIDTDMQILVGLWASAGRDVYNNELNALFGAVKTLGKPLTDRIVGISVGSEDLYRSSPDGVKNKAGVGADAATIHGYIGWLRDWVKNTPLLHGKPIGHVDTWTAWVRPENLRVAQACDFLGHNSFPYFENTKANSIDLGRYNFWDAVAKTQAVQPNKQVWVTETGWPHRGPKSRDAVASPANAQRYWREVGCPTFKNNVRNIWWYTLVDANVAQTEMSFAATPLNSNTPNWNIKCP